MIVNNVINADCYQYIKSIPSNSIDCIYTDIPYLYQKGGSGNSIIAQQVKKMQNELMDNGIYDGIDYSILSEFVRVCKKINIFIWCSKEQIYPILQWFAENTKSTYQILTWNKTNPVPMCNGNWLSDIEYCLYFNKGTKLNDGITHKSKWYTSALNVKDKMLYEHPTIKPVNLVERHLLHTTQPNDIVLDPFCGSGTTCVAAQNIGRQFIGIEISKKWADVAKKRINCETASGQTTLFAI